MLNFIIKLIGTGLPVLLVASPDDYLIYVAMPSFAYLVMGVVSFMIATRKYGIRMPTKTDVGEEREHQLKSSFPVFLNTLFASLYTVANLTILGLFADEYEVGICSGAYKIICAIMMVTSMPLHMSIFPSISRRMERSAEYGWRCYKQMSLYVFLFAVVVSLSTYFASPWAVGILLGGKFVASVPLLRLLSVVPALVIMASMFTVQGLYGLGFQKYATWVGLTVGVVCISLDLLWIPRMGGYGAAYAWIIAQCLEILISGSVVWYNIRKIRNN